MAENKTDIGSQLMSFLSVKRMIALALTGVFCYMVITKREVSTEFYDDFLKHYLLLLRTIYGS